MALVIATLTRLRSDDRPADRLHSGIGKSDAPARAFQQQLLGGHIELRGVHLPAYAPELPAWRNTSGPYAGIVTASC